MKLIHLTDTHFVPPGKTLYGGDPQANLAAAVEDINRHHADADLAVVTGDLTHYGEPEAFELLAQTLSPLKPPLHLLIGNHDDREVFRQCFPDQALDGDGFVQSTVDTEHGRLIFLDTVLDGSHAGRYCEARRSWLAEQLERAAGDDLAVFLFMHHPPFKIGLPPLDAISLQEPEAFAATLTPHIARIRHLFLGHIHRPLAGSWQGIPISSLRSMNHQSWLDFEETEAIAGSFEPPAYSVVLIEPQQVIVHFHDYLDDSLKFSLRKSPVQDWAVRDGRS